MRPRHRPPVQVENTSNVSDLTVDTLNNIVTTSHLNVGNPANNQAAGRLFTDGFESDNFNLWSGGKTGTVAVQSTTVRAGKFAAQFNEAASTGYLTTGITTASTTFSIRAYVYVTTLPTSGVMNIFSLNNGGSSATNLGVYADTTGKLGLVNDNTDAGTNGTALSLNTWHEVELRGTVGTTQNVSVYLDGALQHTYSNTNANAMNTFVLGEYTANTENWYADGISLDTGTNGTGPAASLNVSDGAHIAGDASFGAQVLAQTTSNSTIAFQIQNAASATLFDADTVNNRIYIGGSTASTTPTLLVFANKNSTGDPTGVAGSEYYNSTNNVFRCAQGGTTFVDCIQPFNGNSVAQTIPSATTAYLAGSSINVPGAGLKAGTQFVWRLGLTKSAAGLTAPSFLIKYGTNGSTADATEGSFTLPAETAAADDAQITIIMTVAAVNSTTGSFTVNIQMIHNLTTTGFSTAGSTYESSNTPANFNDTTIGAIVGLACTTGTNDVFTFQTVQVNASNL